MNDKKILQTNNTIQKTFNHTKNGVNIKITLRTDIKQELKDGLEILEVMVKEIKEELK